MDIFVATMLGHLDIKATLTAYPTLITSRGPHGLTLSHHAEKGGEQACGARVSAIGRRTIVRLSAPPADFLKIQGQEFQSEAGLNGIL